MRSDRVDRSEKLSSSTAVQNSQCLWAIIYGLMSALNAVLHLSEEEGERGVTGRKKSIISIVTLVILFFHRKMRSTSELPGKRCIPTGRGGGRETKELALPS